MTPLREAVLEAFTPGGALSRAEPHFQPRDGQTAMALAISHVVEDGGVLVVEAGTGVGKTYSYLVPSLLSGERVLISTATKTLQDQLFGRDLPHVARALGVPVRMALLKGRGSYLCLHRLDLARQNAAPGDRASARSLAQVERWAPLTRTGDLAELPGLDERSPLIPLITSTRENCLGAPCPRFKECHVNLARREALAAEVVVINHHLFFADLAVRESGMAELLPTVRVVVFDEAHQLNETGVQFLGQQLGTGQLLDFARDLLASGLKLARGLADWTLLAARVDRAARDLRLCVGSAAGARLRWSEEAPEQVEPAAWTEALQELRLACEACTEALDTVSELAPDFVRLAERAAALAQRAHNFLRPCADGAVRWLDAGQQLRLVESPLDIAEAVRERMLKAPASTHADAYEHEQADPAAGQGATDDRAAPDPQGDRPASRQRAWVFTSATLGDDERLSWFTEPCGLQDARVLRVGSPFDYAAQAAVYVPRSLPRPSDPGHGAAVAAIAAQGALELGGRTMVLTTTLRALRAIAQALRESLEGEGGSAGVLELLVQGESPKRRLIERFREGAAAGGRGCVLVGSATFWEGVDLPGDALQLLLIDKLPFPPPGDPLVEARSRRLQALGRNPFNDYHLPEAAVALKQGAGRLIRRETDQGVLVVCDPRLVTMGYGRRLLAALPLMRRLQTEPEFAAAIQRLAATRFSTTAPAPCADRA